MQSKEKLIEEVMDNYCEGNRFNFLFRFAGSCAISNIPLEKVLDFYNTFLKQKDDEDRTYLIYLTYSKYNQGERVLTLKQDYPELHEYIKELFDIDIHSEFKATVKRIENLFQRLDKTITEINEEFDKYYEDIDVLNDYNYVSYLKKRNADIEDIQRFQIKKGKDKFQNRVVFLIKNLSNKVVMLVGRDITGKSTFRYLNLGKRRGFFALDYFHKLNSDVAILTEGIFDTISAHKYTGLPSFAILSKIPSRYQLLYLSRFNKIYLALDSDVSLNEKQSIAKKLKDYGVNKVFICDIQGKKDVNELTEKEFLGIMKQAKEY